MTSAERNGTTRRQPLRWRINKAIPRIARRFKAGSWVNRTIYRIGDYWWFWMCFKPMRRAARRAR